MTKRFLFVGEQPSPTAYKKGWTWRDGRLAAKTLFDALKDCGINPDDCGFVNLFGDHPERNSNVEIGARLKCFKAAADAGSKIVALGNKVSMLLGHHGIAHVYMRHPAARGAGRARDVYAAHVKQTLEAA